MFTTIYSLKYYFVGILFMDELGSLQLEKVKNVDI